MQGDFAEVLNLEPKRIGNVQVLGKREFAKVLLLLLKLQERCNKGGSAGKFYRREPLISD